MNTLFDARWLRYAGVVLGGLLFAWLLFEDQTPTASQILGALFCIYLGAWGISISPGWWVPRRIGYFALLGTLVGGLSPAMAFLLLVLKTGVHAHGAPELPLETMLAMLARTPVWAAAGFFLGLSMGMASQIADR